MDVDLGESRVVRLQATTKIEGIVLPAWVAILFGALFLTALLVLALTFQRLGDLRAELAARDKLIHREIRLLQIHAQDVSNAIVKNGIARREDLTPLTNDRGERANP